MKEILGEISHGDGGKKDQADGKQGDGPEVRAKIAPGG